MRITPAIENIETFQPNSYFENLAKLKAEKPQVFAVLSESERLTLTIYLEQKLKHQKLKEKTCEIQTRQRAQ